MNYRKSFFISIHLTFWLFNALREYFFWDVPFYVFLTDECMIILAFYFNYFVLVPKIIKIEKAYSFLIWFIAFTCSFCAFFGISMYVQYELGLLHETLEWIILFSIHVSFHYGGISLLLRLAYTYLVTKESNRSLETMRLKTEIQALKSNIDTPIIISILNDLESVSTVQPNKASLPLLSLSEMLRNSLYQPFEEYVTLNSELQKTNDFLKLVNELDNYSTWTIKQTDLEANKRMIPNLLYKLITFWWLTTKNDIGEDRTIHLFQLENNLLLEYSFNNSKNQKIYFDDLIDLRNLNLISAESTPNKILIKIV